jgi:hypothetical protein
LRSAYPKPIDIGCVGRWVGVNQAKAEMLWCGVVVCCVWYARNY